MEKLVHLNKKKQMRNKLIHPTNYLVICLPNNQKKESNLTVFNAVLAHFAGEEADFSTRHYIFDSIGLNQFWSPGTTNKRATKTKSISIFNTS